MNISTCFGYCSVKTGVLTVGILHIIVNGVAFTMTILDEPDFYDSLLFGLIIKTLFSILLIVGVLQREIKYVFPTVCIHFVDICITGPLLIVNYIREGVIASDGSSFLYALLVVALIVLSVYGYIVVNTFYRELLKEKYGGKISVAVDFIKPADHQET